MNAVTFPGHSIVRKLPGGGMTDIYLALNEQRHHVVIRSLKKEYNRDRAIRKNFLHGQIVLSHLHHPNIVKFLGAGKQGGIPYMILEYLEARTMRDLVAHRDPLLTQNVLSLLRQMATTLLHIHNAGYLHLDFKPDNLLVQNSGLVTLIDFDLAAELKKGKTRVKKLPGTFAYIAPETLKKKIVDERSDIYGFGVTAYEMLTYHKPFEGPTIELSKAAQMDPRRKPTRLSTHNESVPKGLESIVLKCLANEPEERYPSMSLVIKDLEALI